MSQIFKKKKVKILQIVVGVKAIQRCLIVFSLLWTLLREKKEKNGEGEWRREEEEQGSCSVGRSVGWVGNGSVSEWSIMGLTGLV